VCTFCSKIFTKKPECHLRKPIVLKIGKTKVNAIVEETFKGVDMTVISFESVQMYFELHQKSRKPVGELFKKSSIYLFMAVKL
jgi:hypothetical protein